MKKRIERDNDIPDQFVKKKFSQNPQQSFLNALICNYIGLFTSAIGPLLEDRHLKFLNLSNKAIHFKLSIYLKKRKYFSWCRELMSISASLDGLKEIPLFTESMLDPLFLRFDMMGEGAFLKDIRKSYLNAREECRCDIRLDSRRNFLHFLARNDTSVNFLKFFLVLFSKIGLINSSCTTRRCETAFHSLVAGDFYDFERFDSFLEAGADPFIRDRCGSNILNCLVSASRKSGFDLKRYVARLSVLPGFDCNTKDNISDTPFLKYLGSRVVEIEMMKFLIELKADYSHKNSNEMNALHSICRKNYGSEWFSRDVVINKEAVEYLINLGIDLNGIDKHGRTPLDVFCSTHSLVPQDLEAFQLFLERGSSTRTILHSIVKSPVFMGVEDETPTTKAEFLRKVIQEHGLDCNVVNRSLETPLLLLCSDGNFESQSTMFALKELLGLGASPFMRRINNETVLHLLVRNRSGPGVVEAVEIMISLGVDIEIENTSGKKARDILKKRNDYFDQLSSLLNEKK